MSVLKSPVVEISDGKLQGYAMETLLDKQTYYAFKGIPYAKPPVGNLRFAIPEPSEPWEGVRDATKDCNICAQFDDAGKFVVGKEDCLYLNVYTPTLPKTGQDLLPVMVFIHGGGFVHGFATNPTLAGPDFLIEKNTILVSFNYRLGILGFLSLNRKEAPGNVGLRDQVQALKWVQKNIEKFGGDPSNVTIFGISAGGASVEYLLLTPLARGLFHKAIIQSGSTLPHWCINEDMRGIIMKIPQLNGRDPYSDDVLKLLKDMPYKDLVTASALALHADTDWRGGIHYGFVPTIEKPGNWQPFLAESPYKLLSRGEFTRVPVMTGFCTREGLLMRFDGVQILEQLKQNVTFLNHLPFQIEDAQRVGLEEKLKTLYVNKGLYEEDDYAIDFFSDVDFIGGIYVSAGLFSKYNPKVFMYEFSYDGKLNDLKLRFDIKSPGACHGDDLGYLLRASYIPVDGISDTDKLVRERMVRLFTNFAKYGDPTPQTDSILGTKWEPFSEAGRCLLVDDQLRMEPFRYQDRGQLFEQLFKGKYAAE